MSSGQDITTTPIFPIIIVIRLKILQERIENYNGKFSAIKRLKTPIKINGKEVSKNGSQ